MNIIYQLKGKMEPNFIRTLLTLALPISLQQMLTASFSLVDVAMVGQLGKIELASVGLVSKFFFVSIHLLSGLGSGAGILAAQYYGKQEHSAYIKVLAVALLTSLVITVPLGIVSLFFPEWLMGLLSNDPAIISIGTSYLFYTFPYHFLTGIVLAFGSLSRSINYPNLPMLAGLVGIVLNTIFNFVLIFGHFGFPALGVQGAAFATVISRTVECIILIYFINLKKLPLRFHSMLQFIESVSVAGLKKLVKITTPIMLSELTWSFGVFAFYLIYGRMGATELAAMSLIDPLEGIFIQFFVGFGAACTILLGYQLGANKFEEAFNRAKFFMVMIPFGGLLAGILMILFSFPVFALFSQMDSEVLELGREIIYIMGFVLCLKLFNMTTMFGILRSGGDTKMILLIDFISMWGFGVPMAYVGGIVLGFPLQWVFMMLLFEEVVKMVLSFYRVKSRKWLKNLVDN
ncbi:MATE family efflux transporter [Flexithrix dorotheae]|uniref:MATE family efflux transporter n=1 Tax=Flexithrix dorotheae TaxID=70993 RepID=UPI00037D20D1|nr:MATE family efflux transporter [Flexithrix dorotheae]